MTARPDRGGERSVLSSRPRDVARRIAAAGRGVVSRHGLRSAGLTDAMVDGLVREGSLRRLHRGVYAFGPAELPPLGAETAALLACGRGSVLSHRTAAWIWQMRDKPPATVDVTVRGDRRRRHRGITVHRASELERRDIRTREGLPVTAPERTLVDLAAVAERPELTRAVDSARAKRLLRDRRLSELLAATPARRGSARLRSVLTVPGFSRSEAERRVVALVARAGLPLPQRNAVVEGYEIDLWWSRERVAVEIDGWEFHGDREAFEADRLRDARLAAVGIRTLRLTWRRLVEAAEAVLVDLARVLESNPWQRISTSSGG